MATDYRRVADFLRKAVAGKPPEEIARLQPRHDPLPPRVPSGSEITAEAIDAAEIQSPLPEPQPTTGVVLDGPTALPPLPSVAGILISSNRRLAVVNETVVGMGATVGGRVVAGIEPDAVVFREPSGRLVSVRVRSGGTGTIRKP